MPTIMFWSLISCNLKCSNVSPCVKNDAVNDLRQSQRQQPKKKYWVVEEEKGEQDEDDK
ncbi:uncharacterized protein [Drosophila tropicalis]|uniref:uncharacterized protein n=1 Tax=Drosophila tropicalis TaxID=46794 RepID=UPI0035AB859B